MSDLRLKLADGTAIEGTIEGVIGGQLRDLLVTGHAGNGVRVVIDDIDDVEGNGLETIVHIRLHDEDDVGGHALSLRLPDARAARDLQRRLLAAGVAGIVVVGTATTTMLLTDQGPTSGAGSVRAPAVPAPDIPPGLRGEIKGQDIAWPPGPFQTDDRAEDFVGRPGEPRAQ